VPNEANQQSLPRLVFRTEPYDELYFEGKGWFAECDIVDSNDNVYYVTFMTPARIALELESEARKNGACALVEPGLIVVRDMKRKTLEAAIQLVWETERWYFSDRSL